MCDSTNLIHVVNSLCDKLANDCNGNGEKDDLVADQYPQLLPTILDGLYGRWSSSSWSSSNICRFVSIMSKWTFRHFEVAKCSEELLIRLGCPLKIWVKGQEDEEFETEDCSIEDFLKDLFILMKNCRSKVYEEWEINQFNILTESSNEYIRWLCLNIICLIMNLSEVEAQSFKMNYNISKEYDLEQSFNIQKDIESRISKQIVISSMGSRPCGDVKRMEILPEIGLLIMDDLVINTMKNISVKRSDLSIQESTKSNLKEILLSTSSFQSGTCILGEIGSGKTSLIKHVASLFGRNTYPEIIFVQISDSIDSKLLLGSYHSTDLPGKFIWKAGCLTQAVLNGHWIVFEDFDLAPTDVIVLVDGLIGSGKLSVPGYGEINRIHPNFRLFSTCRTLRRNDSSGADKIGKSWKKIPIENLLHDEIKLLICDIFPNLKLIADKLLFILKDVRNEKRNYNQQRIVSLRDFIKFCRRIPPKLDMTQALSAVQIYQEAIDIFVTSLSSVEEKIKLTEKIGIHLNILKAKAEYFIKSYKPYIEIHQDSFSAGRFTLPINQKRLIDLDNNSSTVYSLTRRDSCLIERILGALKQKESILLIGETGVGKTTCVQYISSILNQKLVVVNLSRQSDSSDLLGGYKPVEMKNILSTFREEFQELFTSTFDYSSNRKFMGHLMLCFTEERWSDLIQLMSHVQKSAVKKSIDLDLIKKWIEFGNCLSRVEAQIKASESSPFAFSFVEGTLIQAIKKGYWVLLDEINLASPEMLQCLSNILDEDSEIHLWEKSDNSVVKRHPKFHLFAAMNPSTDIGKRNLPQGLRNRFTEFYVDELTEENDLQKLVSEYLKKCSLSNELINSLVNFYLKIRILMKTSLVDGSGKKPYYSLRTFCRALKCSSLNLFGSVGRSIYESFCLSFLTQLDITSYDIVQQLIAKSIFGKTDLKSILKHSLPQPNGSFIEMEGYWIQQGDEKPHLNENYILTNNVRRNLRDLARIASFGKLPVLIEGETSVGKTSLVEYLAKATGNKCFRINNHQHTDLQEYIGCYTSDTNGKLIFTEGLLVKAMRNGHWIILDELNLAPSEILEALNRLLDDNRQLFISETGQLVTAHPRFMVFATQNPPGSYGGRKLLSRAFRNRFVELHFNEIPTKELEQIIHLRCEIPPSYCKKIIAVIHDLQLRRKASAAFQGKNSFVTLRDMFRWAERYRLSDQQKTRFYDWDQHLADEGFLVLSGKLRNDDEKVVLKEVLEKHFKRSINQDNLFSLHENTSSVTKDILEMILKSNLVGFDHFIWTFEMRRIAVLVSCAIKFKEPILLVGETGCGKTSICQILASLFNLNLFTINCHQNSEASDFLGGYRPVRELDRDRLFEWVDGPLIRAMETGSFFLADEISLADDSVLERLNSLLEPERKLLLAEQGDDSTRLVVAHEKFHFFGTMNPGGDYGKKELSPALRNRLTEIWVRVSSEEDDLEKIIEHNLSSQLKGLEIGKLMIAFLKWLKSEDITYRFVASIRDYLSWVNFINKVTDESTKIPITLAIEHGAKLIFLDRLDNTDSRGSVEDENSFLQKGISYLKNLTLHLNGNNSIEKETFKLALTKEILSIGSFYISRNVCIQDAEFLPEFFIETPSTIGNALRVIRAMQLSKPILLEGSPGVGKTALVSAIAKLCGFEIVRINLSEQTDISDLFGADLPVEGEKGGHFSWRDGPLLKALKSNTWILLDELNLASQSVLEGLNACLDHRGEVFVPELNKTFKIGENYQNTRIFACQNPLRQGGARKGLPKSFLNRFIQVYIVQHSIEDLYLIMKNTCPQITHDNIKIMVKFSDTMNKIVCKSFSNKGSLWDFNLRDLIRWGELVTKTQGLVYPSPALFVDLIYGIRMRNFEDRAKVWRLYNEISRTVLENDSIPAVVWGKSEIIILSNKILCGRASLKREKSLRGVDHSYGIKGHSLVTLQKQLPTIESLSKCLEMGWMPILVGPSTTGKTAVVKLLAEICGINLRIISPSQEMDTIELLGGFEQIDVYRELDELKNTLRELIKNLLKSMLTSSGSGDFSSRRPLIMKVMDIWSRTNDLSTICPGLTDEVEELGVIRARIEVIEETYSSCKSLQSKWNQSGTNLTLELEKNEEWFEWEKESEEFEMELKNIYIHLRNGIQKGAFQWIDSLLVQAMRRGDWLLIDGANRCSPAVLDRLNPLVEPNGSLLLSERGSLDGKIPEIVPDPKFRLILAFDPAFGEISRAMRNRGVEIYMAGESSSSSSIIQKRGCETEYDDDVQLISVAVVEERGAVSEGFGINWSWFDIESLLEAEGMVDFELRKVTMDLLQKISYAFSSHAGGSSHAYSFIQFLQTVARSIIRQIPAGVSTLGAIRYSFLYTLRNVRGLHEKVVEQFINDELPSIENCDINSAPCQRLPLALKNYMNSSHYRCWSNVEIYTMAISSSNPLIHGIRRVCSSSINLFNDFLSVSIYSRIRCEDCKLITMLMKYKFPHQTQLCSQLFLILDKFTELSEDFDMPWDQQWTNNSSSGLGKSMTYFENIARTSLLLHSRVLSTRFGDGNTNGVGNAQDKVLPSSLAFIAQNSGKLLTDLKFKEFLSNFYKVFVNLFQLLEKALGVEYTSFNLLKKPEVEIHEQQDEIAAKVWENGMRILFWIESIYNLCREKVTLPLSENLIAHILIHFLWFEKNLLPFLNTICCNRQFENQITVLLRNCLDVFPIDETTVENGKLFRNYRISNPTLSHFDALNLLQEMLCVEENYWTLNSILRNENEGIISRLDSNDGRNLQQLLCEVYGQIFTNNGFISDDLKEKIFELNKNLTFQRVDEDDVEQNPHENKIKSLKESSIILQELFRLKGGSHEDRGIFTSPLYMTVNNTEFGQSYLVSYLKWEEQDRIRQIVCSQDVGQVGFLEPSFNVLTFNLLSHILLDGESKSFTIPNICTSDMTLEILLKSNRLLSKEILIQRPTQFLRTTLDSVEYELRLNSNSNGNFQHEYFKNKLESFKSSCNSEELCFNLGTLLIEMSSCYMNLSGALPNIDPAVESKILSNCLQNEIEYFQCWLQAQRVNELIKTGVDILQSESGESLFHPYLQSTSTLIRESQEKVKELVKNIRQRPEPPKYNKIRDEICHFISSLKDKMEKFLTVLHKVPMLGTNEMQELLNFSKNIVDSQRDFEGKIFKMHWYWDIVTPFLYASILGVTGHRLIQSYLIEKSVNDDVKENFKAMIQFPIQFKSNIVPSSSLETHANRILLSNVKDLEAQVRIEECFTKDSLEKLDMICNEIIVLWNYKELEDAKKKQEEESLYIFPEDDDNEGNNEFYDLMPDYDKDLDDDRKQALGEIVKPEVNHRYLKDEEVDEFLSAYCNSMKYVKSHWFWNESKKSEFEIIPQFLNRFELGLNFKENVGFKFGHEFLIGTNIALDNLVQNYTNKSVESKKSTYDYYRDSNVAEVTGLKPVLKSLMIKINQLLVEWPEHPSLLKIVEIVKRIESFKINSPIMKFLVGIELLLGTSQEWERSAHSGVSLGIHLKNITDLIIKWRKMELHYWKNLVEFTLVKESKKARRWWFYLYCIIIPNCENPQDPGAGGTLLQTLDLYMRSSTLGEFHIRLEFLQILHCHLLALYQNGLRKIDERVLYLLWNLHQYYSQFSTLIKSKMNDVKGPIEKKIKDFIKISRWNDANFYAISDSVHKNKKFLMKTIKDLSEGLKQPISDFFTTSFQTMDGFDSSTSNTGTVGRKKKVVNGKKVEFKYENYVISQDALVDINIDSKVLTTSSLKSLSKRFKSLDTNFVTMKNTFEESIQVEETLLGPEMECINDLTQVIIETCTHLQSLEAPSEKVIGKEKRRKEVHNIHSRKRTALADLFKALQEELGLSYKRGLMQNTSTSITYDFSVEPIDLEAGWKGISKLFGKVNQEYKVADCNLQNCISGCEEYFQKSLFRLFSMEKSFQKPSKELGLPILERCRGFISDLFKRSLGQKSLLAKYLKSIWTIKVILSCESSRNSNQHDVPVEKKKVDTIYEEICRVEFFLRQLELIFESLRKSLGEELHIDLKQELSRILTNTEIAKKLTKTTVEKIHHEDLVNLVDRNLYKDICGILDKVSQDLGRMSKRFEPSTLLHEICTSFAQEVQDNLRSTLELSERFPNPRAKTSMIHEKFCLGANKLLKEILLTFQKLDSQKDIELERQKQRVAAGTGGESFDGESKSIECLMSPFEKIDEVTENIINIFRKEARVDMILNSLKPLINQYVLTLQYYLSVSAQYHRETVKLLSILTQIFGTLGTKGFCLPSDYDMDQAEKEGQEIDAKGGMGLGDGEIGDQAKDVSDRFESEDQLEDTRSKNQPQKPDEPDEEKTTEEEEQGGIEMSEDFSGNLEEKKNEKKEDGEDSDDDDKSEDGSELDKQMGDVDEDEEQLDERMWGGSSDEEEDDIEKNKDGKEKSGQNDETGIAPKLDEKDSTDQQDQNQDDDQTQDKNAKSQFDENQDNGETNDDQTDPYHRDKDFEDIEKEPEDFELPEDMNLEDLENKNDDENDDGEKGNEEDAFDLDKNKMDIDDMKDADDGSENEKEDQDMDGNENENPDLDDGTEKESNDINIDLEKDEENENEEGQNDDNKNQNQNQLVEEMDPLQQENIDESGEKDLEVNSKNEQQKQQEHQEKSNPGPQLDGTEENIIFDQDTRVDNNKNSDGQSSAQEKTVDSGWGEVDQKDMQNSSKKEKQDKDPVDDDDAKNKEIKEDLKQRKRKNELEKDRKQVDSEEIDEIKEKIKRLKTIDEKEMQAQDMIEDATADEKELFKNVKEGDGDKPEDLITMEDVEENDEKANNQQQLPPEDKKDQDQEDVEEPQKKKSEKLNQDDENLKKTSGRGKDRKKDDGESMLEDLDQNVQDQMDDEDEGDRILTSGASRPSESLIRTDETWAFLNDYESKMEIDLDEPVIVLERVVDLPQSADFNKALSEWRELENSTMSLSQELCENLRLILEPTLAARLKGDFKTGKRLNMRKIIPYIASEFRKDKIWLRRTEPSKREYQIILALDDSASMRDNHSKKMAFSSVAVVAKGLSLLESGQLGIISFGETIQLVHSFQDSFTDFAGAELTTRFTFAQRRTKIAELVNSSVNIFSAEKESGRLKADAQVSQLLLIVSDGRGIWNEGDDSVKMAMRRAKEENVFIVFVIIDNPDNRDSILDIRTPKFDGGGKVEILNYLDQFPFPYYIILRDLNALPNILSDALRQWFELVTMSS